jgi:hypothetical protein
MKQIFKALYHRTTVGRFIIQQYIDLFNYYQDHLVSDKNFVKKRFKSHFGHELNLENPKKLNEKINWLKLYYRTPLHTPCADKYAVREYIKKTVGEEYLVPLYFMTRDYKELLPENLPDTSFIIKTNHDSGGGVVVKSKSLIDWKNIQLKFKKRLQRNYYYRSKEWQYKGIVPCVIVEKLLEGKDGGPPFDYKLHCFNGKVNMIQVDTGRFTENHHRNWYNVNWEREPYRWSSAKGKDKFTDPSIEDVERPKTLEKMIELSEKIAKDFIYVRVDWYDVEDKLFFGEITFHHDGGTRPILPEKWDIKLGEKLILPATKSVE